MKESNRHGLTAREASLHRLGGCYQTRHRVLIEEANGIGHSRLCSLVKSIAELKRAVARWLMFHLALSDWVREIELERRPQVLPFKQLARRLVRVA